MKYLINESKLNQLIYQYIEDMFGNLEFNWTHPEEWDEDNGEIYEDSNRILVYLGDFTDDNEVFLWYNNEYFKEGTNNYESSPLLVVGYGYSEELNALFGDYWKEPLKEWFINNFELPVKTVE